MPDSQFPKQIRLINIYNQPARRFMRGKFNTLILLAVAGVSLFFGRTLGLHKNVGMHKSKAKPSLKNKLKSKHLPEK